MFWSVCQDIIVWLKTLPLNDKSECFFLTGALSSLIVVSNSNSEKALLRQDSTPFLLSSLSLTSLDGEHLAKHARDQAKIRDRAVLIEVEITEPTADMKRQQENALLSSSLSSSYRECNGHVEKTNDLQAKSVGCMSGFFHFVFKYQSRRKSLTSGKKHEKIIVATTKAVKPPQAVAAVPQKSGSIRDAKSTNCAKQCRVMAHETPRSPTIPPEIRLRSGSLDSPRVVTPPPMLVARLMGLSCEADVEAAKEAPQTAAEKRRKLLGALEKCDEDLKALKRIIDVVRSTEMIRSVSEEGPSPASVWDRPRIGSEKQNRSAISITKAKAPQQWKKPGGADQGYNASATNGTTHRNIRLLERITDEPFSSASRLSNGERLAVAAAGASTSLRASKAMTESVEQVCRDVTWGERREAGTIGVALHNHICRELIEETVREMGSSRIDPGQLPYEACRRRLDF